MPAFIPGRAAAPCLKTRSGRPSGYSRRGGRRFSGAGGLRSGAGGSGDALRAAPAACRRGRLPAPAQVLLVLELLLLPLPGPLGLQVQRLRRLRRRCSGSTAASFFTMATGRSPMSVTAAHGARWCGPAPGPSSPCRREGSGTDSCLPRPKAVRPAHGAMPPRPAPARMTRGVLGPGRRAHRLLAHGHRHRRVRARPNQWITICSCHSAPICRFQRVVHLRRDGGVEGALQRPAFPGFFQALRVGAHIGAPAGFFARCSPAASPPSGVLTTRSSAFLSFISRQPTHCRWGIFFGPSA